MTNNVNWENEVRRLRGTLIRKAAAFIDGSNAWNRSGFARDEVALRTLVRVADESTDIDEVLHFIRAKIGQTEPGRRWRYRDFGESLIRELTEGLGAARTDLLSRVGEAGGEAHDPKASAVIDAEAAIRVSRVFLLLCLEHFRYRREIEREAAERAEVKQREAVRKQKAEDRREAKKHVFGEKTRVKRRAEEGEENPTVSKDEQVTADEDSAKAAASLTSTAVEDETETASDAGGGAGAGAGAE